MTALDDALAAPEIILAPPRVWADWDDDGYGVITNTMVASDSFQRTVANSWGTDDTGDTYSTSGGAAGDYDVSPTNGGMIQLSTANAGRLAYFAPSSTATDFEVVAVLQFAFFNAAPDDDISSGVVLRSTDPSNQYIFECIISTTNSVRLRLRKEVAGVFTTIAQHTVSGILHDPGNIYTLRARVTGAVGTAALCQAKLWSDIMAEPNWNISVLDNAFTNGAGKNVGCRSFMGPNFPLINPTLYYKSFTVTALSPITLAGSIDEMSEQAGQAYTIEQSMDDGLPDTVTDTSSADASGKFTASGVVGPPTSAGMTARQYFSPYNTASPLYGRPRDTAPMQVQEGIITATGPQYTPIFTGQMTSLELNGDQADLEGISAARAALMASVKLPMVNAARAGLNATWPVTQCMFACGLDPSPPPGMFARWHSTFHGSIYPNLAEPPLGKAQPDVAYSTYDANGLVDSLATPELGSSHFDLVHGGLIGAPFISSIYTEMKQNSGSQIFQRFNPVRGWPQENPDRSLSSGPNGWSDLLSQANSTARVSGWFYADSFYNTPPYQGSLASHDQFMFQAAVQNPVTGVVIAQVQCTYQNGTGNIFVRLTDSVGNDNFFTPFGAFSPDNLWHFIEFGWNFATGSCWIRIDNTISSGTAGNPDETTLPTTEDAAIAAGLDVSCTFISHLPVADWSLECDASLSTTSLSRKTLWGTGSGARGFTREIQSGYDLAALLEPAARDAWSILGEISQGTLSAIRCDESDVFNFLPPSWFGETAQVTPSGTVTTDDNAEDLDITIDPTKIRNVVTVQIADTRVDSVPSAVFTSTTAQEIPKGKSISVYSLSGLQADTLDNTTGVNLTATNVSGGTGQSVSRHFASINTKSDGTGTYLTAGQVSWAVVAVDCNSVTVAFNNKYNKTVFLANNGDSVPFLSLSGYAVTQADGYVTARDPDSVLLRGERSLSAQLPYNQTRTAGGQAAAQLCGWLARPHGEVTVTVLGDPRREPGQSVTLLDASGTKIAGRWRILSVIHNHNGGSYLQDLTLIELQPLGQWGSARWGENDWNV